MELQELDSLSLNDFKKFLNQEFEIKFETNITLSAQLIEVDEFSKNYSPLERIPFYIILRTFQKKEYYPQAIYTLMHPILGELPIFFVPKGFDTIGMRYEAVFS